MERQHLPMSGFYSSSIRRLALSFLAMIFLGSNLAAAQNKFDIEAFVGPHTSQKKYEIRFTDLDIKENVIAVMTSTDNPTIDAMLIFKNDICRDKFRHINGTGRFKFKCKSGASVQAAFSCGRGPCPIRGKHSQRGKFIWTLTFATGSIPLSEILTFYEPKAAKKAGNTPASVAASTTKPTAKPAVASPTIAEAAVASPTIAKPAVTAANVTSEQTTSAVTISSTPTTTMTSVSASSTRWREAKSAEEAQGFANDIQASIVMFEAIADVIEQQPLILKDRVLSVVKSEITRLRKEKELLQEQLTSRFSTPIRPNNANLSVSAFRAADTFPKIPFYVPGTNEIGEMLVVPRVSDDGYLNYQFDFLDPTSTYDKVRDSIDVAHDDIGALIFGLNKIDEWTKIAQENNVNRRIEKTASCIPDGMCEEKKQGISSTEVVFQVYEDGSTAGRIQRNKGKFMVGYNMSVESSILLSAYLIYMRDVGAKEFNIGVMTDEEVEGLFN